MEKEFVPYQEALALKQLGFDEPCFGWFASDRTLVKEVTEKTDFTLTPTFSQAFRFFREKYNLHNGIYPYYDEYEFQIKDFRLPTNTPINGGLMKYEQAELQCLQELIKIVKNK
jgi:hypothetical protein